MLPPSRILVGSLVAALMLGVAGCGGAGGGSVVDSDGATSNPSTTTPGQTGSGGTSDDSGTPADPGPSTGDPGTPDVGGGDAGSPSTDEPFVPPVADGPVLTHVQLLDSVGGGERLIAFGLPLPEGAVTSGEELVVADSDGNVVASQWSPLASWRTDGSVLHGVMTFQTPATQAAGTYQVRRGTDVSGTVLTKSDVVAAGFDARIEVRTSSGTYSLSAADLLAGSVPAPARQDHTHFAGPLSAEFAVGGPLLLNGSGGPHATLQGYFHVRAYDRPVERARVTLVLENTGAFQSLADVTGDVTLSVGGQTVYSNAGFSIGADKRYPKRSWWGGDPGLWVRHDTEFVQDTGLVPEYREFTVSEERLNNFPRSVDWHGTGELSAAMDAGGAAAYLAPVDRWSAAYLVSADRRAYDAMLAHADAYHWVVSKHNYAMNPRDENTGYPLDLAANPNAIGRGWSGDTSLSAAAQTRLPLKTDMAHQPNCAYLPYLVTGEFDYLEHCQLWGVANWLMERPGSEMGWPRSFYRGQLRAIGWGFRNIVNAAVVTPDAHPLKNTLDEAVGYAIDSFRNDLMPLSSLGVVATGPGVGVAIIYKGDDTPDPDDTGTTGYAPWQDDYLTWALGSAVELGYPADTVWPWKARPVVERLGDGSAYCWAKSALYALAIRPDEASPNYTSWGEVYDANFPGEVCPPVGTTNAGAGDRRANDYAAQMSGALSVAVNTGITGSSAAWNRYLARESSGDFHWWSGGFDKYPEWAIKPREAGGATPVPGDGGSAGDPVDSGTDTTTDTGDTGGDTSGGSGGTDSGGTGGGTLPLPTADDNNGDGVPDVIGSLSVNQWTPISTNTLADVDPCPTRDCPYSAVAGQKAVVYDWTGGAFAGGVGSLGSLIYWGGGHNGYYGTEVYAFDLASLQWRRLSEPTLAQGGGSSRDFGLTGECRFHDGAPIAQHTYDSVVYDPVGQRFYVMAPGDSPSDPPGPSTSCNSTLPAYFDFSSGSWGDAPVAGQGFSRTSASAYDPNRNKIWIHGTRGEGMLSAFDPATGAWDHYSKESGWVDIDMVADIDPMRDLFVMADFRNAGGVRVRDLSNPDNTGVFVNTTGATEIESEVAAGFEWVPELDGFIAWDGGASLYLLEAPAGDWRTGQWTWTRIAATGSAPGEPTNGPYSKFQYVPSLGIAIVANNRDTPVYAVRLVAK